MRITDQYLKAIIQEELEQMKLDENPLAAAGAYLVGRGVRSIARDAGTIVGGLGQGSEEGDTSTASTNPDKPYNPHLDPKNTGTDTAGRKAEEPPQESKQYLKSLVLQELEQMRLREGFISKVGDTVRSGLETQDAGGSKYGYSPEQALGYGTISHRPSRTNEFAAVDDEGNPIIASRGVNPLTGETESGEKTRARDIRTGRDRYRALGRSAVGGGDDTLSRRSGQEPLPETEWAIEDAEDKMDDLFGKSGMRGKPVWKAGEKGVQETKQHLKSLVLQELEQLRERSVLVPHRPHAPRSSINLQRTKTTGTPKAPVHPAPPPPAPPVTLGGGTETMTTNLPGDVVMTRDPGESARFEVGGDDPFGENEPIVDPERTRQIQGYLPPWETGADPDFERSGWEDHPNREQLGDLWYAERAYLDDLNRGEDSTGTSTRADRRSPGSRRKWNAFEIPDYYSPDEAEFILAAGPRGVLYDKNWPPEEDLEGLQELRRWSELAGLGLNELLGKTMNEVL